MHHDEAQGDPPQPLLHSLLVDCLERIESDGEGAIEQVCAEHPEVADRLRAHVGSLHRFGMLVATPRPGDAEADGSPERIPERLGDFKLIERIGGGGMGVVYLAEQTSLKRRIALKLVRPEHLFFPGARTRFAREVETIAQLQHPAIVPIHAVGEEQGIPYFAMELVEGCTLAAVIQSLGPREPGSLAGADFAHAVESVTPGAAAGPRRAEQSWLFAGSHVDTCLRIVRQVADALVHAHERGVLHRDLKPSNVMLTPAGRVILLDFGLASRASTTRLTRSGSIMGSLPYTAPEQLRGGTDRHDVRADVYSLGVTLFEVLTLRLPFAQLDTDALREAITAGKPPAPRRSNPALSRDAETVCLTAMERDPGRRYASAADFARDLDNLLARRPIVARRTGALVHLLRWSQRNPGGAAAAALLAGVVIGGPLAYARFERDARREIESEQGRTLAQKARAERHFRRVLEAVDRIVDPLLADGLGDLPEMERVRSEVLAHAIGVFDRFEPEEAADPALRRDLARANVRLGEILGTLRRREEARANYERALPQLERLVAEAPDDLELAAWLGHALQQIGETELNLGNTATGAEHLVRAIDTLEATLRRDPSRRDVRFMLAKARTQLGFVRISSGSVEEGERLARAAIALAGELVDEDPDDREARFLLADVHGRLGVPLGIIDRGSRRADAMRELELGREQFAELLARDPAARNVKHALAQVLLHVGSTHHDLGERDRAAERLQESIRHYEELQTRFPEIPAYPNELSTVYDVFAVVRGAQGRMDEAIALLEKSRELARASVQREPTNGSAQVHLAVVAGRLGAGLRNQGDLEGARTAFEEALRAFAAGQIAEDHHYMSVASPWRWGLADVRVRLGDPAGAAELIDALVADAGANVEERRKAVILYARCAVKAAESEELTDDERVVEAERYEDAAIEQLRAAAGGIRFAPVERRDPALARLALREEARALLGEGATAPAIERPP